MRWWMRGPLGAVLCAGVGCYAGQHGDDAQLTGTSSGGDGPASEDGSSSGGPGVDDGLGSGQTGLRLLTPTQYRNSVVGVLGSVAVEPVGQWRSSLAAAQGGVSPAGVEDYEEAALDISAQIFSDPAARTELAGCTPQVDPADACVSSVIETLGRRAWRRPLTSEEMDRYTTLASTTAELLDNDPWVGLEHAVAGLLQSPNFLYRVELGEPDADDPDHVRLNAYELASRLSYLVWNTTPDDALLDAAQEGELDDSDQLAAQAERLFDSPRAREGTVQVFVDMLDLDALHSLQKDVALLPAFTPTVGPAMREELVHVVGDVVLDQRDFRRLFDTRQAWVNDELAALYGLEGSFGSEFVSATLPDTRGGLLTYGGFLAINSGEASTSPTKRGLLVRQVLMCMSVPPPPPDVEAMLPENTGEPMTKREQLEKHATDPACAGCHRFTDPIGLALENFDALGGYRELDNGLQIDPSGDLDGEPFADAVGLGTRLAEHPAVPECTIRNLYRYAVGHIEQEEEEATIEFMLEALEGSNYDLRVAIEALVTNEGFRVGTAAPEDGG